MSVVDPVPVLSKPRWRVVLVRLPPGGASALRAVLPRDRTLDLDELPIVLRVVDDHEAAEQTARQIRLVGAAVAMLEESDLPEHSPWCPEHATALASRRCRQCRRAICAECVLAAESHRLCRSCWHERQLRRRNERARQLFVVFLFAVFLLELTRWLSDQAERTRPDGTVTVGLYQFVPPGGMHTPIVRRLNQPSAAEVESLRSVGAWFDRERERYTGRAGPYLRLEVRGPWTQQIAPPPLAGPDDPLWRVALQSWRYARYFGDLTRARDLDPDDVAVRVYVIYGQPDGDLAAHSRGSEKGRLAIAFVALDEQNPAYALATVAHELAHTLGARDLYDESNSLSTYPEGYVEPFAEPLYPQRWAELMAVDRPLGPDVEAEVRSLDELRVGYRTAADLGWIGEEQAEWFYDPPSLHAHEALSSQVDEHGEQAPPEPAEGEGVGPDQSAVEE